eukprot:CFRG2568T1
MKLGSKFGWFALALTALGGCEAKGNTYTDSQKVDVFVNTAGPYYNPSETYPYYRLPVCRPNEIKMATSMGGKLDGDRLAESLYELHFKKNIEKKTLCPLRLKPNDVDDLVKAVEELYYFEFIIDGLSVSHFVGYHKGDTYPHNHEIWFWTHHHFYLYYNGDQIVTVNVTVDRPVQLPEGDENTFDLQAIQFTYSATWTPTDVKYEDRNKLNVGSLQVHWLSIINSFVLVILMVGFVAIILMRVLRSDFNRYSRDHEDIEDIQDDYGWKLISGDVFRFPVFRDVLCAVLGTGVQFLSIVTSLILMALTGVFNTHAHGYVNTVAVVMYAFTSGIAGFVSAKWYKTLGGDRWIRNIIFTTVLFVGPLFFMWCVLNTIAWHYNSTQALPVATVLVLIFLWLLVGLPLTVVGGVIGKNSAQSFDSPCRTKVIPREIPVYPWYRSRTIHLLIGGFLPFSAISVELYYVFLTLWGRHLYTLYGILSAVFFILLIVTACVSITLTYFQLSMEDYRWWWPSIFNVGFTGVYVFLYAIFYYIYRSHMSGPLQTASFFGYTAILCYIITMMLGTIGFFSSVKFVRYIYATVKMD